MAFFDEIGKKLSYTGQEAVKQTKIMANVAKYNGNISALEKQAQDMFLQLGKLYFQDHQNDVDAEYSEQLMAVSKCMKEIEDLRNKIQQEKGVTVCSQCGAEVRNNSLFCNACGAKVEVREEKPVAQNGVACPSCGKMVAQGTAFCTFCGSAMNQSEKKEPLPEWNVEIEKQETESQENVCPQCKQTLEEGSVFCENCGYKISE